MARRIRVSPTLATQGELTRTRMVAYLKRRSTQVAQDGAVGWLGACGTITGLITGAILFKGPATVEQIEHPGGRTIALLVIVLGVLFVFGALWTAASAAYGISASTAASILRRHPTPESYELGVATGRATLVARSRNYLLAGFVLILVPTTVAWAQGPTTTTKLSLCTDLSLGADASVTIGEPDGLPADLSIDDVDELTLEPCPDEGT